MLVYLLELDEFVEEGALALPKAAVRHSSDHLTLKGPKDRLKMPRAK